MLQVSRRSRICNQADRVIGAAAVAVAAAAGAGVVGTIESADAAVVTSGPVNIAVPDTIDGVYMNVVSGATGSSGGSVPGWDVNPYSASTAGTSFNLWGPTTTTWLNLAGQYNLADGTPIGPGGTFGRPGGGTNLATQVALNSDQNVFGFQFTHEGNGNQTHYGWMRLQFGANPGIRSIVEYAYEDTAGTGIPAGVVPEPASLGLLALGATGLLRRRTARA